MPSKNAIAVIGAGVLALSAMTIVLPREPRRSASADQNVQPVIVELFTSEGCSSCPPADALLLQLEASQPVPGARVIAIEEHVDYWNQQGWTDPYSSADWTSRQVEYVARFKEAGPYTPQMIVDGQTQLVGSRQQQAQQAIQQAAAQPKTQIILTAEPSAAGGIPEFHVHVAKLMGASEHDTPEIWLAVTERGLASSVNAGENAGKDLRHASVLRSLHKIGVAKPEGDTAYEASTPVKLKPAWKRQNLQAAVFIQEKKSMRILGAASVEVSN